MTEEEVKSPAEEENMSDDEMLHSEHTLLQARFVLTLKNCD